MRRDCVCCERDCPPFLDNLRYIFIVRRLSVFGITLQLYLLPKSKRNLLQYKIHGQFSPNQRTRPIQQYVAYTYLLSPSWLRPNSSFGQNMAITHAPLVLAIIIPKPLCWCFFLPPFFLYRVTRCREESSRHPLIMMPCLLNSSAVHDLTILAPHYGNCYGIEPSSTIPLI